MIGMRAKGAIYSPAESGRTARRAWVLREAKGVSLRMSDEKVGDDESRSKSLVISSRGLRGFQSAARLARRNKSLVALETWLRDSEIRTKLEK